MKRVAAVSIFFLLAASMLALPAIGQQSWTEIPADTVVEPSPPGPPAPPQPPEGGLTFFTDRGTFQATGALLVTEDFSNNLVGPNNICSDVPPLDSSTNDLCFAAGGVADGFSGTITVDGGGGLYVLLTDGFIGIVGNGFGPNSFSDHLNLDFVPPVNAVGFDVIGDIATAVDVDITIYDDMNNVLGNSSSVGSNPGTFWGVTSDTLIGRIEFNEPLAGGELIGTLEYGILDNESVLEIPTIGAVGAAVLAVLLLGASVAVIRRRQHS